MPVMPSPARKQKIVREFFQKRVIELQTAVIDCVRNALLQTNAVSSHSHADRHPDLPSSHPPYRIA